MRGSPCTPPSDVRRGNRRSARRHDPQHPWGVRAHRSAQRQPRSTRARRSRSRARATAGPRPPASAEPARPSGPVPIETSPLTLPPPQRPRPAEEGQSTKGRPESAEGVAGEDVRRPVDAEVDPRESHREAHQHRDQPDRDLVRPRERETGAEYGQGDRNGGGLGDVSGWEGVAGGGGHELTDVGARSADEWLDELIEGDGASEAEDQLREGGPGSGATVGLDAEGEDEGDEHDRAADPGDVPQGRRKPGGAVLGEVADDG